jgi:hypothetical protein
MFTRTDGRTVEITGDDYRQVYQALQSAFTILAYNRNVEPG